MNMIEWTDQLRFLVAIALGFLVGLERESRGGTLTTKLTAGVRTYTLISLFGFGCAWLFRMNIEFIVPVGIIVIGGMVLASYLAKQKSGAVGWTSEIAALLTFIVGVLALIADIWIAMALGIFTTLLLSEKAELERYIEKLDKSEFLAVIKFLIVTIIILPALPDKDYTRFNLNPYRIWQIVILVSSIGFVGYFLMKKFGEKVGLWLSGLLGGIASSTAVSIAMGNIAKNNKLLAKRAFQATILASSVMYLRILVIIYFLNSGLAMGIWWKLVILSCVGLLLAIIMHDKNSNASSSPISSLHNPFEIRPAVIFAFLFVLLSIVTIWVKLLFGGGGLLALSAVVGVTDIDPFILSIITQKLPIENFIDSAIIISMMSNTIAKG
ncbi:MAG: MgtC/SapB family protein, partial [Ignavibacteria bacterium]|nr:MgtC/SapB family protein [Ignavibacteria bacterium]